MVENQSQRFQGIVKSQNVAFIFSVCIMGTILISLAFSVEGRSLFLSRLLLTFGSSLLGTGFGILLNSFTNQSALASMRELIEHTIRGPLSSTDQELDVFRSTMHNYLLTKVGDRWVWRYRRFDFTKIHTPGKLVATVAVQDPSQSHIIHIYVSEAYLVGPRMILVTTAKNSGEPPIVHVYPFANERFSAYFGGRAILRSWDGVDISSPVLMSSKKLVLKSDYSEGTLNSNLDDEIFSVWKKASKRNGVDFGGEFSA